MIRTPSFIREIALASMMFAIGMMINVSMRRYTF